jgi:drug/metabolite transporter (DMT)-like permease
MSKSLMSWGILLLLALTWGSSFILMKKGMFAADGSTIFSDAQVGALRMLIASLALLPFALPKIHLLKQRKNLVPLAVVGFCGNFFPAFLFTYAETGISSGFAGMLNSFTPVFSLIIGYLIFKVHLNRNQLIGITLGTVGIIALVVSGKNASIHGEWSHIIAIVIATLFYAISLNTIKHKLHGFKATEVSSLAFFTVLPFAILANISVGTLHTIKNHPLSLDALQWIAILAIIGTAIAVVLFSRLIQLTSAVFASSVTYLIPIVAVFIGLWHNETIGIYQFIAMLVILVGVYVTNLKL